MNSHYYVCWLLWEEIEERKLSWIVNRNLVVEALKIRLGNLKQDYQLLGSGKFRTTRGECIGSEIKSLAWRKKPARKQKSFI